MCGCYGQLTTWKILENLACVSQIGLKITVYNQKKYPETGDGAACTSPFEMTDKISVMDVPIGATLGAQIWSQSSDLTEEQSHHLLAMCKQLLAMVLMCHR